MLIGPTLHVWYNLLSRIPFTGNAGAMGGQGCCYDAHSFYPSGALTRMALDQFCFSPFFLSAIIGSIITLEVCVFAYTRTCSYTTPGPPRASDSQAQGRPVYGAQGQLVTVDPIHVSQLSRDAAQPAGSGDQRDGLGVERLHVLCDPCQGGATRCTCSNNKAETTLTDTKHIVKHGLVYGLPGLLNKMPHDLIITWQAARQ